MSRLGDWILKSLSDPSRAQRRRLQSAFKRHATRSRATGLAMSVLAMHARTAIATERMAHFDTDGDWIGVDNRCTGCISHVRSDFVSALTASNRSVKGFGGTRTTNVKVGTIRWKWEDDQGRVHTFDIPNSFYIPDGKVRLLSPQHWAQSQSNSGNRKLKTSCGEHTNGVECVLYWGDGEYKRHIDLGKYDNVATFPLAPGYSQFAAFCCEAGMDDHTREPMAMPSAFISDDESVAHDEVQEQSTLPWSHHWTPPSPPTTTDNPATTAIEFNLDGPSTTTSEGERDDREPAPEVIIDEEDRQSHNDMAELLTIHHQYAHAPMTKLQLMAKSGILPRRLAKCRIPVCSACLYAKATRKPWRSKPRTRNAEDATEPSKPGQVVSVDQLVSPTPGLIAQMTGFLTTKRYRYATVYVDQHSRMGFVYLQKTASAEETVEGKKAFESFAHRHGVRILNYHADNGIFKARLWTEECQRVGQGLTFAGVNAHHQNGIAERRIRELQELARAMLIHANSRWPKNITAHLWPYAVRMAGESINNTPCMQDPERRTPIERFAGTRVASNPKHWKPFGCPVYVLDNDLQGRRPFHKWRHRARLGVYLGRSPHHGRNVALVLDRSTGLVSPQFHVTFDSSFDTVRKSDMHADWLLKTGFASQREARDSTKKGGTPDVPRLEVGGNETTQSRNEEVQNPEPSGRRKRKRQERTLRDKAVSPESRRTREPAAAITAGGNPAASLDGSGTSTVTQGQEKRTRSGRKTKPVTRLLSIMAAEISKLTAGDIEGEIFCYQAMFPEGDHQEYYSDPLLAYKAVSDPDTLYYHEAMKQSDRAEFKRGMKKEIQDQFNNGNFIVIHKSAVPEGQVVLPAVWQMRRKRDAKTGQIKKYKARLNIDGSRMKRGVHYTETYSPVASWNSVRMLLTLTAVHGWHTKQIDFVQAFAQAPVEKTLYMKIPAGMVLEDGADARDYVLEIHRNIYGQKQAGRVWNKFLVDKLVNELGFTQSKVDECVFFRGSTMYVLYTDDSLLAGPNKREIDDIIVELKTKAKLAITVEGDLADFLGVNIERKSDGTIHLTQPHLIDQILKDLRMDNDNVKPRSTPAASSKLLARHLESPRFDDSFNYRSVIGKLNYLEKATRSDISYAVHQCARFVSDPRKEHGDAVRWLGRYLKGTRDKGTILNPMPNKDLEVYVDASFCGDWDPKSAADDRDTARSRHGYIINYAGCPLLWKSQLQTEIALSTTESEYTGLSYALRDAIPIMELLKELKQYGYPITTAKAKVHCKVFEDNSGALEMARTRKYRPRTKHLNIRLHHFRDYVERGDISIHAIGTNEQPADYLTKALNEETLTKHRKVAMGW